MHGLYSNVICIYVVFKYNVTIQYCQDKKNCNYSVREYIQPEKINQNIWWWQQRLSMKLRMLQVWTSRQECVGKTITEPRVNNFDHLCDPQRNTAPSVGFATTQKNHTGKIDESGNFVLSAVKLILAGDTICVTSLVENLFRKIALQVEVVDMSSVQDSNAIFSCLFC